MHIWLKTRDKKILTKYYPNRKKSLKNNLSENLEIIFMSVNI